MKRNQKEQVLKGASGDIRTKIEQVGKGASGRDINQDQPGPERAPAGSKPQDFNSIFKRLLTIEGLEPAGARSGPGSSWLVSVPLAPFPTCFILDVCFSS